MPRQKVKHTFKISNVPLVQILNLFIRQIWLKLNAQHRLYGENTRFSFNNVNCTKWLFCYDDFKQKHKIRWFKQSK